MNDEFGVEGESFYIGRSDQADITVKNALFSRKHIKIKFEEGELKVQDLDTTNGTTLNNEKLDPHEWYSFSDMDDIGIGEGKVTIQVKNMSAGERSKVINLNDFKQEEDCLLYTSSSPRD